MKTIQKLAISAMFATLVCVATMIIKIPSPLKGYINLGDCVVLLSGWILPPGYGFLAAGIGSVLADVFSGYAVYAPATFVIKGVMALIAYIVYKIFSKKTKDFSARLISGLFAEATMILGYFLFEGVMYGFAPSLVNIPANAVQGVAGIIIGIILIKIFQKQNLIQIFKL
ncbi:MAG: ECF transporter S component [Clostridia bacterium]|nr:ECF transporter S component [Clostridia bacterium]